MGDTQCVYLRGSSEGAVKKVLVGSGVTLHDVMNTIHE
jgi:hypothetical protein